MTSTPGSLLAAPLRGADRPRIEVRPPTITASFGPEACVLAEAAGLPPDGWQADGVDLMLSTRADGFWACRTYAELVGRQEGKSVGIGIPRVLAGLLLLGERLIMWSAHEVKTAIETFLVMRQALATLGEDAGPNLIAIDDGAGGHILVKVNNTNGQEGFTLSTGQRVLFVARSKGSGRGFTGDTLIIDEAFAYTRVQQAALAPTRLARPNSQTVYLSSPPLTGASGDVLFAVRKRALSGSARIGYRDWGSEVELEDVARLSEVRRRRWLDDRARWAAHLPALGGRVIEESVEELREELDDLSFAREVLGCWPRQLHAGLGWEVIKETDWAARGVAFARFGDTFPPGPVAFAVAGSWPDADHAAIAVVGGGQGGEPLVGQIVEYHPGTGWVLARLAQLVERHQPVAVVIDEGGPAGHLIEDVDAAGIDVVKPKVRGVAHASRQLLAHLHDEPTPDEADVDDPDAVAASATDRTPLLHFDQPELTAAAQAGGRRPLGDAWTWQRRGEVDVSPLEALSLAVWGLAHSAPPPPPPVPVEARTETAGLMTIGF